VVVDSRCVRISVVTPSPEQTGGGETAAITVRYWASARSAAGVHSDALPVTGPLTLSDVVRRAVALHPGSRLPGVLEVCSVLVGDRPVASTAPEAVVVEPGQTVEFLPPFAGG
jgi:molybdopterin converting factor small subunit